MSPYDIIMLIGSPGNQALDSAESSIKKANDILKGLGGTQ